MTPKGGTTPQRLKPPFRRYVEFPGWTAEMLSELTLHDLGFAYEEG